MVDLISVALGREQVVSTSPPVPIQNAGAGTSAGAMPAAGAPGATLLQNVPGVDARDGINGGRALSEGGNAGRLYDLHADDLRYCPEAGAWLHWEGGCWLWDVDGSKVRTLAGALRDQIYQEGAANIAQAHYYIKWARTSYTERVIKNTVSMLSDNQRLRVPVDYIDGDAFLLGIDGCRKVVDLRTGSVRAARQADMVTKCAGVDAVGDAAKAVVWAKFLDDVFLGDQEMIGWLQRLMGYMLSGSTVEHLFPFAYGAGANGKSVLVSLMAELWGDYHKTIQVESLMEQTRQAGGASSDLACLPGARLVTASETEQGRMLAESRIKQMTGGDRMSARETYGRQFEFTPAFKLFLMGNHKPTVRGTDNGIWRRMRLIPFVRIFTEQEQDKSLGQKLRAEREHIMAWVIQGCVEWQRRGLDATPAIVKGATAEYREDEDHIGEYLTLRCVIGATGGDGKLLRSPAQKLYDPYKVWAEGTGAKAWTLKRFSMNISERPGVTRVKTNTCNVFEGISLRPEGAVRAM
jgi:P4 family phage/plasmid primase-like protien